jgi:peptide-methionine (S)-S-oxide reductase
MNSTSLFAVIRRIAAPASLCVAALGSAAVVIFLLAPLGSAAERSVALPDAAIDATLAHGASQPQTAVFSGGCFWGVQAVFEHVNGVVSATSGYSGGTMKDPSYEDVSSGSTGHAESVRVVYDPARITYGQLLKVFFSVAHDPTQLNRQGPDSGTQYRSALFYLTPEQEKIARAYTQQLDAAHVFGRPIVTQLAPLSAFYVAEGYHQDYARLHPDNPYIVINDLPKVAALKTQFPSLYRTQ